MKTDVNVHTRDVARNITMNVRLVGMREFTIRIWIASKLIQLATLVAGFGSLKVDFEE